MARTLGRVMLRSLGGGPRTPDESPLKDPSRLHAGFTFSYAWPRHPSPATSQGARMTVKRSLQAILAVSLFGVAFSGFLSYREVFGHGALTCPAVGAPGTVFGYPACVYGFFMYLLLAFLAGAGLEAERRR